MNYSYSDLTPPNTYEIAKRRTVMRLCRGIIHKVEIQFPIGCAEVVHCHINRGLHQVWPSNPEANYTSDGHVISFVESYELLTPPYIMDVWTWNESENHNHKITVWISILPKRSLMHYILPEIGRIFSRGNK